MFGVFVIVEWFDAQPVARSEQLAFLAVPDNKREHAVQALDRVRPFQHKQAQNDFGIGIGEELHALAGQLLAQLDVVVNLAVIDNPVAPGFFPHGLVTGLRQVNDAQAQVGNAQVFICVESAIIRPAVSDAVRHAVQRALFHLVAFINIIDAANSAHESSLIS